MTMMMEMLLLSVVKLKFHLFFIYHLIMAINHNPSFGIWLGYNNNMCPTF